MAYKPTLKDAQEVVGHTGYVPTLADINEGLGKTGKPASALKSLLVGAGQGLSDTAISAINAADIGGNKINQLMGGHAPVVPMVQHPDIAQHLGVDTSAHPYIRGAGEIAGGSVLPGGAYVKGLKLLPEAKGILGLAKVPALGGATGYTFGEDDEGNRGVATALGAVGAPLGHAIPKAYRGIKSTRDMLAVRKEIQQKIQALTGVKLPDSSEKAKAVIEHTQLSSASKFNSAISKVENALEGNKSSIQNILGDNSRATSRTNLNSALSDVKGSVNDEASNNFDSLENSAIGQKLIQNPLTPTDLPKFAARHLSPLSQSNLSRRIGTIDKAIESKSGKSFQIESGLNPTPTVKDYIKFYRTTRDEASNLHQAANNASTADERDILRHKALTLGTLRDSIKSKIEDTMSPEEKNFWDSINSHYSNIVKPFQENPTLRRAASGNKGNISSKDFMNVLEQPGNDMLRAHILTGDKAAPLKQAILEHDLRGLDLSNPDKIEGVLSSDIAGIMPKELQDALGKHVTMLNGLKVLQNSKKYIQSSEVKKAIDANELGMLHHQNPSLAAALGRTSTARAAASSIAKKESAQKLSHQETERALKAQQQKINEGLAKHDQRMHAMKKTLPIAAGAALIPGFHYLKEVL
ncbi:MAG: hypothetical protein V4501_11245 [Pseudomonadota bacterium]